MKKSNVIFLVLLLVIGFAAVSTTLFLNGDITIGTKVDDFDVIFTEALLNEEKSENVIISEDKKSITFISDRLRELNESVVLDYKVKNTSTQYGSNVTINCNNYGNEYIDITGEFDGKTIPFENPVEIEAQEIKNGYIKAELINVYTGEDDSIDITCTIVASATEKDEITDYIPLTYKDDTLNGTDPVLANELIPITLEDDGTVIYANIEDKWYDYKNKEWANAVILEDGVSYKVGDTIDEDDIQSYFVWIPRFRYQIFHAEQDNTYITGTPTDSSIAKEIQIVFESRNAEVSNGRKDGEWLTHPAFTNFDVNGLWVGKFETGYNGATSKETAQVSSSDSSKIIIKPNTYSWRSNTVSNIFKAAYNYNRDLDSHMMKNTEWGAVAYLSHSKYGINTEININNNSNYLTGYSAVEGTDQSSYPGTSGTAANITLPYNTPTGYKASTTGNITGVYDMAGGVHEYMAAYSGIGASGFTTAELTQYSKYFDVYPSSSTITSWNNRILGDATGEMGPFYYYADKDGSKRCHNNWYADGSNFVDSTATWFIRGAYYGNGVLAGQFYFDRYTGEVLSGAGSRLVIAV